MDSCIDILHHSAVHVVLLVVHNLDSVTNRSYTITLISTMQCLFGLGNSIHMIINLQMNQSEFIMALYIITGTY